MAAGNGLRLDVAPGGQELTLEDPLIFAPRSLLPLGVPFQVLPGQPTERLGTALDLFLLGGVLALTLGVNQRAQPTEERPVTMSRIPASFLNVRITNPPSIP